MRYFIQRGGYTFGPYHPEDLPHLRLKEHTLIREENSVMWQKAMDIAELSPFIRGRKGKRKSKKINLLNIFLLASIIAITIFVLIKFFS